MVSAPGTRVTSYICVNLVTTRVGVTGGRDDVGKRGTRSIQYVVKA